MKLLYSLNLSVLLCLLLLLGFNAVRAQEEQAPPDEGEAVAEAVEETPVEQTGRAIADSMPELVDGAMIRVDIPTDDLQESREFYGEVFGWTFSENEETKGRILTWEDPAGNTGGLTTFVAPGEGTGVVVYLFSDDLDESFKRINRAGGKTINFTMEIEQGRATVGLFNDPQGNMLGLVCPND